MRVVVTSKNIDLIRKKLPKEEKKSLNVDDYKNRLIKYIPAEIVALYLTLYGLAQSAEATIPFVQINWLIFIIGLVLTPLFIYYIQEHRNYTQIIMQTIAFFVWVFALGGPFSLYDWYIPVYGSMFLVVFTFIIPFIDKEKKS